MKKISLCLIALLFVGCCEDGKVTIRIGLRNAPKLEKPEKVVEEEKAIVAMVLSVYTGDAFVPEDLKERLKLYKVDDIMKEEWVQLSPEERKTLSSYLSKVRKRINKNIEDSMLSPELEKKFKRLKPAKEVK